MSISKRITAILPALTLLGLLVGLSACGGPTGPGLLVEREGRATRPAAAVIPDAGPELRHTGRRPEPKTNATSPDLLANLFDYDLPPGWQQLAPSSFRFINLRPAGDTRMECYLSVLASDGGGVAANVNRWREQMGLERLDAEAVDVLPRRDLLSGEGIYLDLRGSFAGMGEGDGLEDWGLLGLIVPIPGQTLFVKMTGPADLIEAETQAFADLCASLRPSAKGVAAAMGVQGPTQTSEAGGLAWDPAPGWSYQGPKTMRMVSYQVGSGTECYLALARGEQLQNFNRWRTQVGLEPMDQAAVDALETVKVLGEACAMLEITGDYRGMGGPVNAGYTLLGVMRPLAGDALFVKMIGPAEEVAAARDEFLEFCASIRQAD